MSSDALRWVANALPDIDLWQIPGDEGKPRSLHYDGLKLLLHLCDRANDKHGGLIWCTRKDMIEQTNLSSRSVDRWLGGFERIGIISRVGEIANKRGRPTPVYRLICVPKYARDERELPDYLPNNRPGGQVEFVANTDAASKTTKTENREPKPKPKPQPEPVRTVHVPAQQAGLGKEIENAQIDNELLQSLTAQAVSLDAAEHGTLTIPAALAKRERDLQTTLADFLPRYPDVSHDFLVSTAVDLVYAIFKGATPEHARHDADYVLSEAQRRARARADNQREVATWSAMTPEERNADRERTIADQKFVQTTLAEMRSKVGRRMPPDDPPF